MEVPEYKVHDTFKPEVTEVTDRLIFSEVAMNLYHTSGRLSEVHDGLGGTPKEGVASSKFPFIGVQLPFCETIISCALEKLSLVGGAIGCETEKTLVKTNRSRGKKYFFISFVINVTNLII
jgi:hypothetical protein